MNMRAPPVTSAVGEQWKAVRLGYTKNVHWRESILDPLDTTLDLSLPFISDPQRRPHGEKLPELPNGVINNDKDVEVGSAQADTRRNGERAAKRTEEGKGARRRLKKHRPGSASLPSRSRADTQHQQAATPRKGTLGRYLEQLAHAFSRKREPSEKAKGKALAREEDLEDEGDDLFLNHQFEAFYIPDVGTSASAWPKIPQPPRNLQRPDDLTTPSSPWVVVSSPTDYNADRQPAHMPPRRRRWRSRLRSLFLPDSYRKPRSSAGRLDTWLPSLHWHYQGRRGKNRNE